MQKSRIQAKAFSVSTVGSPTKPLTRAVSPPVENMNILHKIYHDSRTNIADLSDELLEYLPQDKHDPDRINRLSELDAKKLRPLLPHLLTWIQDINWPNAGMIIPFLIKDEKAIISEVEWVLMGKDDIWKGNCIRHILMQLSPEIVQPLLPTLKRIAENPSENEKAEEIDFDAAACIEHLHSD